ncbi:unnamed protein product [Lactuca virosa]|uniref:Uncharacterized protein n=1 Tax=Lactuca virosa TaxID=75947 RepID=A0AAU9LRQ5_9ASTR|nr:unnamed protein product [Lactuca virosa]
MNMSAAFVMILSSSVQFLPCFFLMSVMFPDVLFLPSSDRKKIIHCAVISGRFGASTLTIEKGCRVRNLIDLLNQHHWWNYAQTLPLALLEVYLCLEDINNTKLCQKGFLI